MEVWEVVVMVLITVAAVLAFCYWLVRRYSDTRDSHIVTTFSSVVALSLTLFCVLLIPVDIYIVSSGIDSNGVQKNPDVVTDSGNTLKWIYYTMYIFLIIFAFGAMPFSYFYFEEDGENITVAQRTKEALKYTAAFVVIFIVLLVLGIVLKKNISSDSDDDQWQDKLSGSFNETDAIISFVVSILAILGLTGWIFYTAYGLAAIPIKMMRNVGDRALTRAEEANVELRLRKYDEDMKFIASKYELSTRDWEAADRVKHNKLKRESERLRNLRDVKPETKLNSLENAWNTIAPIRVIAGIFLLCVSLLLVISILLSTADRFQNSDCGASCGYALTQPSLWNPIDKAMVAFSKVFPIDYVFFALLVCYFMMATISGLVALGVRCLCFKLYDVEKGQTQPHALVMGTWLVMMCMLVLNMQIITLAPQYATFGQEYYYNWKVNGTLGVVTPPQGGVILPPANSFSFRTANAPAIAEIIASTLAKSPLPASPLDWQAAPTNASDCPLNPDLPGCVKDGGQQQCSLKTTNLTNQCVQTQVGVFVNTINVQLPYFGTILFCANILFLAAYFIYVIYVICRKDEQKGYVKLDNEGNEIPKLWGAGAD